MVQAFNVLGDRDRLTQIGVHGPAALSTKFSTPIFVRTSRPSPVSRFSPQYLRILLLDVPKSIVADTTFKERKKRCVEEPSSLSRTQHRSAGWRWIVGYAVLLGPTSLLALSLGAGSAAAQTVEERSVTASSSTAISAQSRGSRTQIPEEIVITARKRKETVQDIPLSVTALSGRDLAAQHVDDALDIQFKAPNLFFSKTNFTSFNLQIRGIGAAVTGASSEQAVGLHVNTVPLITSRLFEQEFFDMDRVEVLRGPQGTLFGRNSTGGSVNLFTRKPTDDYEASVEVQGGNFTAVRLKGSLNVPINDAIRTRVAAMYHRRDGFIENLGTGNDIDDRNLFAVRGSVQIDFTDDLQLDIMASYFREDDRRSRIGKQLCTTDPNPPPFSLGCSDAAAGSRPGFGTITGHGTLAGIFESFGLADINPALALVPIGVDFNADAVNPADLRVHDARIDPSYFADELFVMFDLHQDFESARVSWVSGYQSALVDSRQDFNMTQASLAWDPAAIVGLAASGLPSDSPSDPTMATMLDLGRFGLTNRTAAEDRSREKIEQVSTELRVVSNLEGPINFTAGAAYAHYVTRTDYEVFFTGAEVLGRLAQLANPAYDPTLFHFNNETKPARFNSLGVFGEGYWSITEALRFTFGARYTWDNKTDRSRNFLLDPSGVLPEFARREESWHEPTGRASLEYKFDLDESNDMMVFLSGARGYKPGGFNPPAAADFPGVGQTFDPETLWAVELGSKNQFLNRKVIFNLTGFFYDYRDYQISQIVARTAINENVNALLWGLEAELTANPFDAFVVNASIAYLGSRIRDTSSIDPANPTAGDPAWTAIKDLSNGSNTITSNPQDPTNPEFWNPDGGIAQDLDGNELPSAPDVQINIGAAYTFDAPWDGTLTARASYYWQSAMFSRIFNAPFDRIDSWSQADASIRWTDSSYTVWVDLWVKNLIDNDEITGQFLTDASSGNFTNVFLLDPRTFGATVGVDWP